MCLKFWSDFPSTAGWAISPKKYGSDEKMRQTRYVLNSNLHLDGCDAGWWSQVQNTVGRWMKQWDIQLHKNAVTRSHIVFQHFDMQMKKDSCDFKWRCCSSSAEVSTLLTYVQIQNSSAIRRHFGISSLIATMTTLSPSTSPCLPFIWVSPWAAVGWRSTSPPVIPPSPAGWDCRCHEWRGGLVPKPGRRRWRWEPATGRRTPDWRAARGQRSNPQRSTGGKKHKIGPYWKIETNVVGLKKLLCVGHVLCFCCTFSHTPSNTLLLSSTASHYTRRSMRTAKVLMDVFPSSAGGLWPPGSSSCCGLKPPSVCCLSRSLATVSASPSIATIAKPTRHGASTAATRELYGARSVCGGSFTHTYRQGASWWSH